MLSDINGVILTASEIFMYTVYNRVSSDFVYRVTPSDLISKR